MPKRFKRQQLYDLVWTQPTRTVWLQKLVFQMWRWPKWVARHISRARHESKRLAKLGNRKSLTGDGPTQAQFPERQFNPFYALAKNAVG